MIETPRSGALSDGKVRVSGVVGQASLVQTRRAGTPCTLQDHGDGTIDIVAPPDMGPDEGFFVIWKDDNGEHHTAVVSQPPPRLSLQEQLDALAVRVANLEKVR